MQIRFETCQEAEMVWLKLFKLSLVKVQILDLSQQMLVLQQLGIQLLRVS